MRRKLQLEDLQKSPYTHNDIQSDEGQTPTYSAVVADQELEEEIMRRRSKKLFPLHVFPSEIHPLISVLKHKLDGERGFIGQSILAAASVAVGSALRASTGMWEVCLSMWSASVGISSSGKTMIQKVLFGPLMAIQDNYDEAFQEKYTREPNPNSPHPQRVIIYNDITFESLIRDVLQDNFKGICRHEEELLKWLEDMDRYKSGKSEESFWIATWSPSSNFTMRRTGGKFSFIKRDHLVASVFGSTQSGVLCKFYDQHRLQTGFTYRMLFAFPEANRVISPDLSYQIPHEQMSAYSSMIESLYRDLPMNHRDAEPRVIRVSEEGVRVLQRWQDWHTKEINKEDNATLHEIKAGIYGKIKEYALRFSLLLTCMDVACRKKDLKAINKIEVDAMRRAIEVADYFMSTGMEAYHISRSEKIVPSKVLRFAATLKALQFNQSAMAAKENVSRQAIHKMYNEYLDKYPSAFGAINNGNKGRS